MPSGNAVIVPSYDAKANLEAIIAPTVNNDETEGYEPGSLWIDTVASQAYICVDATTGAANWKTFGGIPAGGLLYKGAWNASTNSPTLGDNGAGGIKGDYYVVSVAGATSIDGISDWKVLDWIVNNGTIWEKVDNTQAAHDMGGSFHIADTLANLNTKVSDATLVDKGHGHTGAADGAILNQPGPLTFAPWGTVSVTAGLAAVVGVGTFFTWESVGALIVIAGEDHRILAIADDTHLTLVANHVAGASGAQYFRNQGRTAYGHEALKTELEAGATVRQDVVAIGYRAAARLANLYGYTTAVGAHALSSCVDGNENTAFGALAAKEIVDGGSNVAVGVYALRNTVDGSRNMALGPNALELNVSGDDNVAIGYRALQDSLGAENTAIGSKASRLNTTGVNNVALGREALYSNLTGDNNVALGYQAGYGETGSDKLYIANGPDNADALIYGDFATRMLGFGTLSPTAGLHLQGVLTDALTGTVTVAIGTPNVVGSGTAFDTELQVEDAIKIADEIFTVQAIADATHLTLDSNHVAGVAGVTAYRDPDLYRIQTGDGLDRFVFTKSGFAAFGDFTTSHGLGALGDVGIGGKFEVAGPAYLDNDVYFANTTHYLGSMIPGSNIKIYASTAVGSIQLRNTIQTPDAPMLLTGPLANHWVICEQADEGVDFAHPQQPNPTIFIQAADVTDIGDFISLSYSGLLAGQMITDKVPFDFTIKGAGAKSGAVTNDDGGNLILEGGDKDGSGNDGIVQVGAGFSTSHSLVDKNDFGIDGKLEVNSLAYFDGGAAYYSTSYLISGINFLLGSSNYGVLKMSTGQTPDCVVLSPGDLSNALIFCEYADKDVDFGFPQQVNPTLCVQSADATTPAQRITLAHNQTDGVVAVEAGDLDIQTPAQKTFKLGTPVWDDHRVSLVEVQAGGLKPPTWAQFKDDGSSSVGVYAWAFGDEAVGANEEQLFFAAQLPHGYKEGTDILAHVHWEAAVGGAAGEFVKWGLEYVWVNIDGIFGNTTIIASDASGASTATTSEDGAMVADKHYKTKIGTIAGSGKAISSMLVCRIFRNSSDSDDDLAQDAFGLEIDFHYQIDTMGSRQELAK